MDCSLTVERPTIFQLPLQVSVVDVKFHQILLYVVLFYDYCQLSISSVLAAEVQKRRSTFLIMSQKFNRVGALFFMHFSERKDECW